MGFKFVLFCAIVVSFLHAVHAYSLMGTAANATVVRVDLETFSLTSIAVQTPFLEEWMSNLCTLSESTNMFGAVGLWKKSFVWVEFNGKGVVSSSRPLKALSAHIVADRINRGDILCRVISQRIFLLIMAEVPFDQPGNTTLYELKIDAEPTLVEVFNVPSSNPYTSFLGSGSIASIFSVVPLGADEYGLEIDFLDVETGKKQTARFSNEWPFDLADPSQYYLANSSGTIYWLAPSGIEPFHSVLYYLQCTTLNGFLCTPVSVGFLYSPSFPVGGCSGIVAGELLTFVTPITLADTVVGARDLPTNVTFARVSLVDASVKRGEAKLDPQQIALLTSIQSCVLVQ